MPHAKLQNLQARNPMFSPITHCMDTSACRPPNLSNILKGLPHAIEMDFENRCLWSGAFQKAKSIIFNIWFDCSYLRCSFFNRILPQNVCETTIHTKFVVLRGSSLGRSALGKVTLRDSITRFLTTGFLWIIFSRALEYPMICFEFFSSKYTTSGKWQKFFGDILFWHYRVVVYVYR